MKSLAASIAAAVLLAAALPGKVQAQEEPPPEEAPIEHKLTKPPKLVTFVEAEYPPDKKAAGTQASVTLEIEYTDQARADGVEGKLKLRVTISATGEVTNVEVLAGVQASLDAAAIASVKQWRFKPAMRCGKPFAGGTFVIARTFELGD